jgi:Domain of unknown function (DUF4260)
MAGYLGSNCLGVQLYNTAYSTVLPAAGIGLGWRQSKSLVLAIGLVWLARIGIDRSSATARRTTEFQHTAPATLAAPGAPPSAASAATPGSPATR